MFATEMAIGLLCLLRLFGKLGGGLCILKF
jgi:hypothetical protein